MPRDRRTPSRGQKSLTNLLDDSDGVVEARRRTSRNTPDRGYFELRKTGQETSLTSNPDLQSLLAMFEGTYENDIIVGAYHSCGYSLMATIDALLNLQTSGASQSETIAGDVEECYWDLLPNECKLLIFDNLSLRDMARMAGASREFALHVRQQRQRITTLNISSKLTLKGMRGMVAAHVYARAVSISKCAAILRDQDAFERVFVAIGAGSKDRAGGCGIESIDLRGCSALTNSDVGALCLTLPDLREVDVGGCYDLTDDALCTLSRYQRHDGDHLYESGALSLVASDPEEDLQRAITASLLPQFHSPAQPCSHVEAPSLDRDSLGASPAPFCWMDAASMHAVAPPSTSTEEAAGASEHAVASEEGTRGLVHNLSIGGDESSRTGLASASDATSLDREASAVLPSPSQRSRSTSEAADLSRPTASSTLGLECMSRSTSDVSTPMCTPASSSQLDVKSLGARIEQASTAKRQPNGRGGNGLVRIRAAGIDRLSEEGVKRVFSSSGTGKCLQELDVSRCPKLKKLALSFSPKSTFRQLKANSCKGLRSVRIQSTGAAPLEALSFASCPMLEELHVSSNKLQELNFSTCTALRDVLLVCPKLVRLQASQCPRLTSFGADFQCPVLQEINLFGCRNFDTEGWESLVASCTELRVVNLNGCTAIRRVNLTRAVQLERIDVSGCPHLATMVIGGDSCHTVLAKNCKRMTDLGVPAASLALLDLTNCGQLRDIRLDAAAKSPTQNQEGPSKQPRQALALNLDGCPLIGESFYRRLEALGLN